jgi:hypothetical protein
MKKLNKLVVGVFCALLLVTSAFAADNNVRVVTAPSLSLFNAGEVGFSLGSSYTVDRGGATVTPAPVVNNDGCRYEGATVVKHGTISSYFHEPYTLNVNGGVFYFPYRNLGLEANVPFYQSKGVSVDEVQAGVVLRLPLAKTTPVFRNLSPYVGVGGVYNWQSSQRLAYVGKAGLEVRLNKKWGVFGEAQYRNADFTVNHGQTSLNGGLRFVF